MSKKGIIVAGGAAAAAAPEAVDFDGTNDYLSRSSALSGSSDTGKTLTFSVWVYYEPITSAGHGVKVLDIGGGSYAGFTMRVGGYQTAAIVAQYNSSWATAINDMYNDSSTPIAGVPQSGWNHILYSVDLNNTTSSMYINDVLANPGTDGSSLVNQPMLFTTYGHQINIGRQHGTTSVNMLGRLAHLFLDFTYRNLSTESNRRLFINADMTPNETGMDGLSPIMYMKLTDPATAHVNSGSGGNFTLNGTVALSGRGPNQYNSPACTFDGSADYLSTTSLTGVANSKVFTLSFNFKHFSVGYQSIIALGTLGDVDYFFIRAQNSGGGEQYLNLQAFNSSYTSILNYNSNSAARHVFNKWYSVQISIDLSDTDKRHVIIDGVVQAGTWTVYTDDTIDFTHGGNTIGVSTYGAVHAEDRFDGNLSDLYFQDGEYINLSADNPFWDSDLGKPKDLGADGSTPTGTAPLIYLPLRGAYGAGDNKGTGGDFTVNSGPYTGARGPSEYWADCAESNGTAYLARTSTFGLSDGKEVTMAVAYQFGAALNGGMEFRSASPSSIRMKVFFESSKVDIEFTDTSGGNVLRCIITWNTTAVAGDWRGFYITADLTNSSNRYAVPLNDTISSINWATYSNTNIGWTDMDSNELFRANGGAVRASKIGFLYLSDVYAGNDEANKLKMFDAFDYPVDIGTDGSEFSGTAPALFMNTNFHLGTDSSGNGNNFTSTGGTVTDGGHVKG